MNICIVGLGYVGLSNLALLSKNNEITGVDNNQEIIDALESGRLHINEYGIRDQLLKYKKNINFATDINHVNKEVDVFIVAVPTNYDPITNHFDVSIIDSVITRISEINKNSYILIKSTVPVGYTEYISNKLDNKKIIFSPEFLREGMAFIDSLEPSRIIISGNDRGSNLIQEIYTESIHNKNVDVLFMDSKEAEAVKLFSNTYLAMRVAFINELDNFCIANDLISKKIIDGVCLDPRIGAGYNNPSFGFGGYCLPKDTQQMSSMCEKLPNILIKSIYASNLARANYLYEDIKKTGKNIIGIYKVAMKEGSDNHRSSSIFNIINKLKDYGCQIILYDESIVELNDYEVMFDFNDFVEKSELILTNRLDEKLKPYSDKVYTRDVYNVS